ncbi:RecX family transcriptional regulator, partial [Patescibacteria group bacterium]|nr:RecX family transcriptional regulator [Patescibacteria group bacterium]
MPIIKRIRPVDKDKFQLIFGDGQKVVLSSLVLVKFKLSVGQEISLEKREEVVSFVFFQKGYEKALQLLSFRPRTEREIKQRLGRLKIASVSVVEQVIKKLQEKDYLNDEAFARWWCDQRIRFRPRSQRMVVSELVKKGVE